MNQTYRILPIYTGDVSGVCSALYELGGMVVIHDPSGCNSTYNTHDETRWYDNDSLIFLSGLCERDAILGRDDKFLSDVVRAAEELHPAFIALTNSPIPFMNGTDFAALARIIEKRTKLPTFYVRANGMHDYTVGAGNAFAALADYMSAERDDRSQRAFVRRLEADDRRPFEDERRPAAVNILGLTPLDFDAAGSVDIIMEFLRTHGFETNVCLGMGACPEEWKQAPRADVNLVVSSAGVALARKMEQQYGIPYVAGIPTGAFAEVLSEQLRIAFEKQTSVVAYSDTAAGSTGSARRLVFIGEAVTMGSLSAAISLRCGIRPQMICPLETWQGLLRDGDYHTEGEEDLSQLLGELAAADGGPLIVAADPLYRPILPENVRFFPLSHEAFSGRCFRKDRKCLVGEHAAAVEELLRVMEKELIDFPDVSRRESRGEES